MFFLFTSLYNYFSKHKIVFVFILLAVIAFAAYFSSKIVLDEDVSRIMPRDERTKKLNFILQNTKFTDKLVVNVSLKDTSAESDPDKLIAFVNELVDSLRNDYFAANIKEILYKIPDDLMMDVSNILFENLPLFLNENDYNLIDSLITREAVNASLRKNYRTLISPAGMALKQFIIRDPVGISRPAFNKLQSLRFEKNYKIYDGYILTKDNKNLLFFITPECSANETSKNAIFLEKLDVVLVAVTKHFKNAVGAEYFGAAAVAVGNAQRIKNDIILTVTIALIVLLLMISMFFRRVSVFFFIFLPAIFGGGLAIAIIYLTHTSVSAIALGIGSVLLGITVDYSLHIFTHFRHKGSVIETIKDITLPVFISSITTATAFFCLYIVSSEALHELGLFAALSVLIAAFFSLFILPHVLGQSQKARKKRVLKSSLIDKVTSYALDKNRIVITIILLLSVVFFFTSRNVSFETDMMKMNYVSKKLAQAEDNLDRINNYKLKSVYLVSSGKDLNQALSFNEKVLKQLEILKEKEIVKNYTSASLLLLSEASQRKRIEVWNKYWTEVKKRKLIELVKTESKQYKFNENAFNEFFTILDKKFQTMQAEDFNKLKNLFFNELITEKENIATVATLLKVEQNDKQKIYEAFENFSDVFVFDKQYMLTSFVDILRKDFNVLVQISLLLVFLILVVSFGRIELGLITFIPMALSWLWTLGIMGMFGIKFNIFNIVISTFIFGLGIDYSIFIMRGLLKEHRTGENILVSYKTSILLSAVTTIVGVGVLIFAKHPALQSIALLTIIGIISVVVISYTIEPILFRWLISNRKKRGIFPITFFNFFKTSFALFILVLGCFILVVFALILYIMPIGISRKKNIYHYFFMYASRFFLFIIPIRINHINRSGEKFAKPSVIISNHQSLIDFPMVFSLTPKLIVLTNDWVMNSKLFGNVSKYADFHSASSGIEDSIKKFSEKVKEGYSIMIFPEGTRSETSEIKRFHNGAFYIAEKLNIDIVPVLIQGTSFFLKKNEILGTSQRVSMEIFERITPDDVRFGLNYSERTKSVCKLYRERQKEVVRKYGIPSYLKKNLINNYLYKGPVLEWYLKAKLKFENNYNLFNDYVPDEGVITDIGCGYGFLCYLLSFVSDKRKITGIDHDEEKIKVANNCYSKNRNINFVCADITKYKFDKSDIFFISDVLHYFPEDQQEKLIVNCLNNLNDNGTVIIRDANREMKKRHFVTILTEIFSTRFGFNKVNNKQKKLFFTSKEKVLSIVSNYNVDVEVIDNTRLTSNIVFIIKKKSE